MKTQKNWTWSELDSSHLPLLVELISKIEQYDQAPIRTSATEIATYFDNAYVWRAQGAWVDQKLVAFGLARALQPGGSNFAITLSGGVLPLWRSQGLGAQLLERQIQVAREIATRMNIVDGQALLYIESDHENFSQLAYARGFRRQATFVQVRGHSPFP